MYSTLHITNEQWTTVMPTSTNITHQVELYWEVTSNMIIFK